MTLREILARRAQRHQKVAESKKSAFGRKSRRERLAERKLNHFIESRENMTNRKHYILVEDEQNDDDLVEIETDDTVVDTDVKADEEVSKEDVVKTLEDLASQLGYKLVPSEEDEDKVEAEVEVKDEVEEESKDTTCETCKEGEECKVAEAEDEKKDEEDAEASDKSDDEDKSEEDKEEVEAEVEVKDDETKTDEEDPEFVAKKLADLTPGEWLSIIAKIED